MGLIAHYRLDGDAEDTLGGEAGSTSNVSWVDGKLGKAGDFTRGSGNGVWIPHDDYLSRKVFGVGTTLSFAFWVYPREYSNHGIVIGKQSGDWLSNSTSSVWITGGGIRFQLGTNESGNPPGSQASLTQAPTLNQWHHIACVADGERMYYYLNGELAISGRITLSRPRSENANDIQIGTPRTGGNEGINALLQDVRIYDHALSPREVRDLSLGMVGHYPLRRDAINAAGYDSGSIHGSVVFSDVMGGSAEFDNSSYIQLETGITGDPDELSASFWAKTDSLQAYDGLLQFDGVSGHEDGFVVTGASSTAMRFRYWSDGGTNTAWSVGDFATGKESHFCVTLKDNLFTIYQDGEKVGGHTYSNPFNLSGGAKLGLYSWSSNYFTGWIKDARIYATALTPSQVKELYQQRASIDSEGNLHVS